MAKIINVTVHNDDDASAIEKLAECLRSNGDEARQLRDFSDMITSDQHVRGIQFQPSPGQILVCQFGIGFRAPEMVKTRPVLVISTKQSPWTKLCVVVPISSTPPNPILDHHYLLPQGLLPRDKYKNAWIKGDMVMAVGSHRLDRIKLGNRSYGSPRVPPQVLEEARKCVLCAIGLKSLTK